MVTGTILFEGTVAELPGVVIYGTTGLAVLEDTQQLRLL